MKKIFLLVITLAPIILFGQQSKIDPIITEKWKEVDRLNSIGNYEQTAPLLSDIKAYAKKVKNQPMEVRAILAESQLLRINTTEEDLFDKVEKHFLENIKQTGPIQKSLLYSFYAQFLGSNMNYYSESKNKFLLADEKTKFKILDSLFNKSVENKKQLLDQPIEQWTSLFADSSNLILTPTLYHFNVNTYLAFLKLDREKNKSKIEKITTELITINQKSNYSNANSYLLSKNVFIKNGDHEKYIAAYKDIITKNKSDYNAYLYTLIAGLYQQNRDLMKAVETLEIAKKEYPNSPWLADVKMLENILKMSELSFKNAAVIPSKEYSPITLSFRNTEQLFIKVFNSTNTPTNYKNNEVKLDSISKKVTVNATEQYTEEIKLKSFSDYQMHSTIYKINPLPYGNYIMLLSNNDEFIDDGQFKTVASTNFVVSDQFVNSEIENVKKKTQDFSGILINRKTGIGYRNMEIKVYDVNSGKSPKILNQVKTNDFGEFSIQINRDETYKYQSTVQIYLPDEKQLIPVGRTQIFDFGVFNNDLNQKQINTRILTDRSIYRPGQKIYFKGIVFNSNILAGKIEERKKVEVILQDANGQKIDSLTLTSNSFGSVNGEFNIPSNTLAGGFNILILENKKQIGYHYLQVEEYKRPTFTVKFETNKETYKRSDIAEFIGSAESLSGAKLSGANVNYKVQVNAYDENYTNFILEDSSVIADDQGKFKIRIPLEDTALAKMNTFTLSINAEVVNQTGEMQQTNTFYTYSDKPWVINIINPQLVAEGKWDSLEIRTVNQNNQPLNFAGEVRIYKHPEPGISIPNIHQNIFANIEYNLLSNEEYKKYFPTIFDESLFSKKKPELIKSYIFDTRDTGIIKLDADLFKKGKYSIEAISIQERDTIESESYISIYDPVTKKASNHDFLSFNFDKDSYAEDDQVKVTFYTDVPNAQEILIFPNNFLTKLETITIPVKDGKAVYEFKLDKDKFDKSYKFEALLIVDNKLENATINIPIKGKDQDFTIKINTFRDKILPGIKEKWSFNILQKNKVVSAEVLATMYDMSLDVFGGNYYAAYFDRNTPNYFRAFYYLQSVFNSKNTSNEFSGGSFEGNVIGSELPQVYNYNLWTEYWLNNLHFYGSGDLRMKLAGATPGIVASSNGMQQMDRVYKKNEISAAESSELQEVFVNAIPDELKMREPPIIEKDQSANPNLDQVEVRKNLKETAFFYPNLYTDKDGNISFEFESPEALTKWKLMLFAHGKNLEVGSNQFITQTQKQLMVRPNLPRYFRESDEIEIIAQVQNLSDKSQKGQAKIEIINPIDNSNITDKFVISPLTPDFSVEKENNQTVSWKLKIPEGYQTVQVKIVAASDSYSDGEIQELPILSNKVLISETEKITIKAGEKADFNINSVGKNNLQAKVQVQSNPILEIISALDYLKNYPYECTEQNTSKWFGYKMVQYIGKHYPTISDYFKTVKSRETKSRLEENAQLNELKLQEMPWLRDIQQDDKKLAELAELFNSNIEGELKVLEQKILRTQLDNGALPWFEGGKADTYISMRILEVVGKVYNLDHSLLNNEMNSGMIKLANFLDRDTTITREKSSATIALDYLYARHFWNAEVEVPEKNSNILKTRIVQAPLITAKGAAGNAAKAWIVNQLFGAGKESNEIKNRIQQEAILDPERGIYWESNSNSYNDISLQSYMLEAYKLYDPTKLNQISQWIFFKKEANYWRSTWMTVDAIYSLLLTNNPKDFSLDNSVTVLIDKQKPLMDSVVLGQVSKTFYKEELNSNKLVQLENNNDRTIFGGIFHQYFVPVSEVKSSTNDIKISKEYLVERNGKWVESSEAKLGERIKVLITVINDQNLEYVHLKDSRPAGVEPEFVPSGYSWRNNYYFTLKDASTNYFFNNLAKGKRSVEYFVKANNLGIFNSGITSIESMYDPTVNARSHNKVIKIVK